MLRSLNRDSSSWRRSSIQDFSSILTFNFAAVSEDIVSLMSHSSQMKSSHSSLLLHAACKYLDMEDFHFHFLKNFEHHTMSGIESFLYTSDVYLPSLKILYLITSARSSLQSINASSLRASIFLISFHLVFFYSFDNFIARIS